MTQELRKLAEAAINDEWRHVPADDLHGHYIETCGSAETICDLYFTTNKRHDFRKSEQNAAYIAAANPAAILSLLDRLEKAEKDAERYRWLRSPDTDVSLVIDKLTGWVPPDEHVEGVGGYHTYEYRAGEELDTAIDAAMEASK